MVLDRIFFWEGDLSRSNTKEYLSYYYYCSTIFFGITDEMSKKSSRIPEVIAANTFNFFGYDAATYNKEVRQSITLPENPFQQI